MALFVLAGLLTIGACLALLAQPRSLSARLYEAVYDHQVAGTTDFQQLGVRDTLFDLDEGRGVYSVDGYLSMWFAPNDSSNFAEEMISGATAATYSRYLDTALVIGAGTGSTPSITARLFGTTDLIDLDPNTPALLEYFADENNHLLEQPSVRLRVTDALSWLASTERTFDAIINAATAPAFHGANSVFTREFMQQAKARLRPGGVFITWIGTIDRVEGMKALWQTVRTVFPYTAWVKLFGGYYLVVGSNEPLSQQRHRIMPHLALNQQHILQAYILGNQGCPFGTTLVDFIVGRSVMSVPDSHTDDDWNTLNRPILAYTGGISWIPGMGTSDAEIRRGRAWLRQKVLDSPGCS